MKRNLSVDVKVGVNTNRIFSLKTKFEPFSYSATLRRFDDIKNCLKQLKVETQLTMVKKSYDLTISITNQFKNNVKRDQSQIVSAFEQGRLQNK